MVLFKRKPVVFLPRPTIEDEDTEVWIIPETQELFFTYESYLQRMDWYKAKKFICEISGHSGLSFFDALKSELAGAREVEGSFPEPLKSPVLRKVQFSTISRIDNLVDKVFDDFKNDFYPGEQVSVMVEGERHNAVVKEKARFPEIKDIQTGEITREAFTRYFVRIMDKLNTEVLVDDAKVSRDRKIFTKQMLRSFIKNTVSREAWNGAPWLVKPEVAEIFRIDTQVPRHLQYGHKIAEKREKKKAEQQENNPAFSPNRLPDLKPALKGKRGSMTSSQAEELQQQQWDEYRQVHGMDPNGWPPGSPPADYNGRQKSYTWGLLPPNGRAPCNGGAAAAPRPTAAPLPPPIKYPIEDMDCPPLNMGITRPPLKFVTQAQLSSASDQGTANIIPALHENNLGLLLETWNTLNVYCQVLQLDSFTFDDFVNAMLYQNFHENDCELLSEVHCAILKKLVNASSDQNGAIQITLPDLPETESSDAEEEQQEESRVSSPSPEPDVPARRTRSSLNKMMLAEEEKAVSEVSDEAVPHRAAEMFTDDYGWIDRLRKRDFQDGGWQFILAGLLHQVAGRSRLKDVCTRVLMWLAPLEKEPTLETVREQYNIMDINLRADALQTICQLFLETKCVKTFLEDMAHTMTQFRKLKIEHQRARKESIAILKRLHDDRKILAPLEKSPTPAPELEELEAEDPEKLVDASAINTDDEIADSDEERPMTTRSLRRGQDREAERKRKREEEKEKKDKAKEEKTNKGSKEYQKVLKAIEKERDKIAEHEEQIEIVDGDLREADAYRTRCLGKDRFCNRYWWFERNAMPFGGLPDSSTADAGYANGRLWVQGPDDMEREGYIDVAQEAKYNYSRCFGVTPAERKKQEEGSTSLDFAHQWGFYDSPEDVDNLINWLDNRGVRELKLRKELCLQKKVLEMYMQTRQEWLFPELREAREKLEKAELEAESQNGRDGASEETESEDEQIKPAPTRMSTRAKQTTAPPSQAELSQYPPDLLKQYPCLRWRNSMAVREIGHRHMDPPPSSARGRKKDAKRVGSYDPIGGLHQHTNSGGFMAVNVNEGRTTRGAAMQAANPQTQTSRSGRTVGRVGWKVD